MRSIPNRGRDVRVSSGLGAVLLAALALAACTTPAASTAPTDAMMEHSPVPTDAMMEHSPAPTDAMMEHSPAPTDAMMEHSPAPS